ncbi:MMPL family transporter [Smaragdicoccus niigatensis]|uniref:MMPL family transporter n=1 Tax=Smaragdicoccus niigatensis TaxID=359359 RepID=UPI00035C693A|nr:MMPL family transporter [Smaragdicoccus niigatensis]
MLRTIAQFCVTRPKAVLGAVGVLLILCIVLGSNVTQRLGVAGFSNPDSESSRAAVLIADKFGGTPNLVLEVQSQQGNVDDPAVADVANQTAKVVAGEPSAKVVSSYWRDHATDLRSQDGQSGLIMVQISGTEDQAAKTARRIIKDLPGDSNASVKAGGLLGLQVETEKQVSGDLVISEAMAIPVTLVFLVIVFGGLIAAVLPLSLGVTSIIAALGVLAILTRITDVSVHALTVATAFGLGLSIDFGLLMVSRFREERASGLEHDAAIVETVASAGRTIVFSAATVALAMSGLLVFPTYFLRSVGLAASVVVILSALSAITVMPAVMALLGNRIDSLRIFRRSPAPPESEFWRRCAQKVIRKPLVFALPVIAVLLALGIPFLHAQYATPDERALPPGSPAREVTQSVRANYSVDSSSAITIITETDPDSLRAMAEPISRLPGVSRVDGSFGSFAQGKQVAEPSPASAGFSAGNSGYVLVQMSVSSQSDQARDLVDKIRTDFTDGKGLVGGPAAVLVDSRAAVTDNLGVAILIIAVATFVMMFLFTGSVIVPIKALTLNLFVLSGVLGLMVLIFQDGWFAGALGVTPAPLGLPMVVLLCCIAFSLSVDYEIFLLSRIKEARDSGLSNDVAIVAGLSKVGRIVSSAAILLTITLVSFTNGLSFMKMFGIGTALAVTLDATVIRGIVVPAFLRVAGELNWWAPAPLRRFYERFGLRESDGKPSPTTSSTSREVEVLPGHHVVAAVDGIAAVISRRDTESDSASLAWSVLEVARRSRNDGVALAAGLSEIAVQMRADLGVAIPSANGLTVFLRGSATSTLDGSEGARTVLACLDAEHGDCYRVPLPLGPITLAIRDGNAMDLDGPREPGNNRLANWMAFGQGAVLWPVGSMTVLPPPPPSPAAPEPAPAPMPVSVAEPTGRFEPFSIPPPVAARIEIPRVTLDDGTAFDVDGDYLVGRNPSVSREPGFRTMRIDDPQVSRVHAAIRTINGDVYVVDQDSHNGVYLQTSDGTWSRVPTRVPTVWRPGTEVRIGNRVLRLELVSAATSKVR